MRYDPQDWYWLADDGRVYASGRQVVVDKADPGFLERQEAGAVTRWPVNEAGAQTAAALQDVFDRAGAAVFVSGAPRTVQGAVLVHVLDKATKVCPRDLAYVAGLQSAREDMVSLTRIAAVDGSNAKAWFDAALGAG